MKTSGQRGFSLIEVLFAIFIAGFLAITIGATLIISLRSEQQRKGRLAGALWANRLLCEAYIGAEPMGDSPVSDGRVSYDEERTGQAPSQTVWRVTHLFLPDAAFRARFVYAANPDQMTTVNPEDEPASGDTP